MAGDPRSVGAGKIADDTWPVAPADVALVASRLVRRGGTPLLGHTNAAHSDRGK